MKIQQTTKPGRKTKRRGIFLNKEIINMLGNPVKSNKKQWTGEEDALLLNLVQEHGTNGSWPTIALHMEWRSGKQCRERYVNQLDPLIKKTVWTLDEDAAIKSMHYQFGKKWCKFMEKLPGRSDNAIKNRYHIISRNNYSDHNKNTAENEIEVMRNVERINQGKEEPTFVPETCAVRLDRFRIARDILDRKIAALLQEQESADPPKNPRKASSGTHHNKSQNMMVLGEDPDAVAAAILDSPDLEFAFCMKPAAIHQGVDFPFLPEAADSLSQPSQGTSHCLTTSSGEFPSDEDNFDDFNFDYDELFHEYDYGQYLGGAPAAKVLELAPTAQKAVLAELAALTAAAAAASSSSGASVTSMESNSVA